MTEKPNIPPFLFEHTPWESGPNTIWPATSFTLHRNLARYNFPPKLSPDHFKQILTILTEKLLASPYLAQPTCLKAEELSPHDKEFLYEHFLCTDGFQNSLAGQGFIIDKSSAFLALINIEDHLLLKLIDSQGTWESAWNKLNQVESTLGEAIDYAFSPRFGYLTSDPTLCGTGLITQAYLHLPALVHTGQLQETLIKQADESILEYGMEGTLEDLAGDLLIVSNSFTLGQSEENILHAVQSTAMKLMALEKTLRTQLKNENNLDMRDHVSRAYGLLLHSYQLQTKETLGALSLLKLGLDLGWIEGVTDGMLNTLFFKCRRAHLAEIVGATLTDPHEAASKRSEFIRQQMDKVHLNIKN